MVNLWHRGFAIAIACLSAFAVLAGCFSHGTTSQHGKAPVAKRAGNPPPTPIVDPALAGISRQPWLRLEVFQMALPAGSISRNSDFWKHIDEQRLDPPTYDLLLKNGVRVGVAPNDDWGYFREILERNHAESPTIGVATANGGGTVELSMKKAIPSEDIFYLSDKNEVHGRTYEHCENLLGVSFLPEPRRAGEVRLSISPTVRSLRSYMQYSVLNHESEIRDIRPEYLYELNLRVVIPADSFLVITPSRESKWPSSLGNTFFHVDGQAEQFEQVLILAPRAGTRLGPTAAAR